MGVVYKADDTKLDRKVALKFLAPHLLENEESRRRFAREAKAAAALDHPNICTVYEIDEVDGRMFIAMAFIDGPGLNEKIETSPLKLKDALDIAIQAGQGLDEAHQKGIVHRDIKPANIMLVERGRSQTQVKITDFGLAQLAGSSKITRDNSTLGTVAYMSPEQTQGEKVDHGTDIWALGVVLYEMISGQLPFRGEYDAAVMYSILNEAPEPITALRTGVPIELDRVIDKALGKSPERRYQHIDEMLADMRTLRDGLESAQTKPTPIPAKPPPANRRAVYAGLAALVAVLILVGTYWSGSFGSAEQPAQATLQTVPLTSYPGLERQPALSPDGNQVAFVWNGENQDNDDIYVQLVGAGRPLRLTTDPAADTSPAWSPDGRYIAFLRPSPSGRDVMMVPALGGGERKLGESEIASARLGLAGLSWAPDGSYLAILDGRGSYAGSLSLLSTATGEKQSFPLPPPGANTPAISPNGQVLAVRVGIVTGHVAAANLPSGEDDEIELRPLTFDVAFIRGLDWTADSRYIVFSSNRAGSQNLWKVAVSGGEPERLSLGSGSAFNPSIARQGKRLVFEERVFDANIWRTPGPNWGRHSADKSESKPRAFLASTRSDGSPHFSPDGEKIVFASDRSAMRDIWISDSDGTNPVQLTSLGSFLADSPQWSPDSRQIAFDLTLGANEVSLHVVSAGGGAPRRLTSGLYRDIRSSWSRDGRWIYFGSNRAEGSGEYQVWKVPSTGGDPVQVTKNGGREPYESSDGKFVYYSKSSGITGIWRVPADGGDEVQALDHGQQGRWALLDNGIVFVDDTQTSIQFFDFATKEISTVTTLPEGTRLSSPKQMTVSPDGKWILYVNRDHMQSDIMLVENFE